MKGVEHTIHVTAQTLYEAVAQALYVLRENEWADPLESGGMSTLAVRISQPQVEHRVRIKDFRNWLESAGRTPAEMALKTRLREMIQG